MLEVQKTPLWLKKAFSDCVWDLPGTDRSIYLTFDDGPEPRFTSFVLAQLKNYAAKASFFLIGSKVVQYPELVQEIKESGHDIGNHTYDHMKGWNHPISNYLTSVDRCDQAIEAAVGEEPKLFRPPYGRITWSQKQRLKVDKRIVMWDYLTADYDPKISPKECLERANNAIRPGSIVVFHDNQKSFDTLRFVLPQYLERLSDSGYKLKSLSEGLTTI